MTDIATMRRHLFPLRRQPFPHLRTPPQSVKPAAPRSPEPARPHPGNANIPSERTIDGDGVDKREVTFDDNMGLRLPVADVTDNIFLPEEA